MQIMLLPFSPLSLLFLLFIANIPNALGQSSPFEFCPKPFALSGCDYCQRNEQNMQTERIFVGKLVMSVRFVPRGNIGAGGQAEVRHARPVQLKDLRDNRVTKCVALKVFKVDQDGVDGRRENFGREVEMLRRFSRAGSSRVIQLIQFGHLENGDPVIVMELGKGDLRQALADYRAQVLYPHPHRATPAPFGPFAESILSQVLSAADDFHRVGIHMDLKPANFLFVDTPRGEVLKLIDLGSSIAIPAGRENAPVKVPNADLVSSPFYEAPEYNIRYPDDQRVFSTKTDIWAVGVILQQMLLMDPKYALYNDGRAIYDPTDGSLENEKVLLHWMTEVVGLYRAAQNKVSHHKAILLNKAYALQMVIDSRMRHPRLHSVIMATLSLDPAERPTAKGILQFLRGECQFRLQDMDNLGNYVLPNLTGEQVHQMLLQSREDRFSREELDSLLRSQVAGFGGQRACDTGRN